MKTKRIMKCGPQCHGYVRVTIRNKRIGFKKCMVVHRLVAMTFIPNPDRLPEVNHINGDKTDNRVENLEWCTAKENILHAFHTGLHKISYGESNPLAKYTECQIRKACEMIESNLSSKKISDEVGIPRKLVNSIVAGSTWTAISKDYDFSKYKYKKMNHMKLHNSIDRAIIKGISSSEILQVLYMHMPKTRADKLLYHRKQAVKEGRSIVLNTIYIDDGVEIF